MTGCQKFLLRGNVVDLAVGVVIGAAFGKIVSGLVENVVMPPLGLLLSGVDFKDAAVAIGTGSNGEPVLLKYGAFIQTMIDFTIIAFVLFLAIKGINRLKKPAPNAPPPAPTADVVLLTEIRDLLRKQQV